MKSQKGQTLLEVVVVIAVVAIVLTALVSSVTAALRYGQSSQNRSRAVKLAQEGLEISRKLRDSTGWAALYDKSQQFSGRWCLAENGDFTGDSGSGACPISNGSSLWRLMSYSWNTAESRLEVTATVSWGLRNDQSTVQLKTYLTEWK